MDLLRVPECLQPHGERILAALQHRDLAAVRSVRWKETRQADVRQRAANETSRRHRARRWRRFPPRTGRHPVHRRQAGWSRNRSAARASRRAARRASFPRGQGLVAWVDAVRSHEASGRVYGNEEFRAFMGWPFPAGPHAGDAGDRCDAARRMRVDARRSRASFGARAVQDHGRCACRGGPALRFSCGVLRRASQGGPGDRRRCVVRALAVAPAGRARFRQRRCRVTSEPAGNWRCSSSPAHSASALETTHGPISRGRQAACGRRVRRNDHGGRPVRDRQQRAPDRGSHRACAGTRRTPC